MNKIGKIAIIGGGHMTTALIAGWSAKSRRLMSKITVAERNASKRRHLSGSYGIKVVSSQAELPPDAEFVLLAVKPADIPAVCGVITQKKATIISVAAGVSVRAIASGMSFKPYQIIRVMPNTPFALGAGMSVCYGSPVKAAVKSQVTELLEYGGSVLWAQKESMLEAVTAVSGSGPAYIYYFAEAMEKSACEMGFTSSAARRLVVQTIFGGGEMLIKSGKSAESLREAVSVPGGTTERAISVMKHRKLSAIVSEAMRACQTHAEEIARVSEPPRSRKSKRPRK